MESSKIAPNQTGSRLTALLSLGSALLAVFAAVGLVVLATRMARLDDELATAGKHADQRIAEANAKAEAAKAELARLTQRVAETERQATLLTEAARPRSISKAQETVIVRKLAGLTRQTVEVQALGTSHEASAFAEEISRTLRAASFAADTSLVIGPSLQGLAVMCDPKAASGVAKRIQSAFSSAGIPMDTLADASPAKTTCLIIVGSKASL